MYVKTGDQFWPVSDGNLDVHKVLEPACYDVKVDKIKGFYFEKTEPFAIPAKLYGDINDTSERILNTYRSRSGTTGVLLQGLKGSGKTMLSKLVSAKAREQDGLPTILIGAAYSGPEFISILKNVGKAVIIFDEFEKMYDEEEGEQDGLLSLFDGVFTTQSLIMVTANDSYRISGFFKNRPGRIFYNLKFAGLDPRFVKEYCEDRLEDKSQIQSVVDLTSVTNNYSFDMVQALVEEMNRYKEPAVDALKFLNFETDDWDNDRFKVSLTINGDTIQIPSFRGNPLMRDEFTIAFNISQNAPTLGRLGDDGKFNLQGLLDEADEYDDDDLQPIPVNQPVAKDNGIRSVLFKSDMLISKDHENRTYTYKHPSGAIAVFTPYVYPDESLWVERAL